MSVKSNPKQNYFYELDIMKIASSLGIDQDRLLAYVYSNMEVSKRKEDRTAQSAISVEDHT
ncbi:hypothetical protein [Paenibacillus aceris]|uniref:Uncharacterized protein n=1 Tax=Paenibacillus aceris TaxID=869555 RepID=A0ABS4HY59_9BACL|nr:hypothetical protein [Paenibacillus aceris]MBP1963568.1 hypothetical protein [Paenibacillus aceris]NHW36832.1 hypothetical protein [Paenibacillus aceris]